MQPDQRHLELAGKMLGVDALAQSCGIGRPAADGEVLAANNTAPTVDPAEADDEVGRREATELAGVVVFRPAGRLAEFLEAEVSKFGQMESKVETAITRLLEYRTALITAAVTGKIDVRGVQQ